MRRLFRFLDMGLALASITALALVLFSGWPGAALAHDVHVGSGRPASEVRALGEFQAVTIADDITVRIRQGAQASAKVQTDDNLLPLLETVIELRGTTRTLQIRWAKNTVLRSHAATSIDLSVVQLQKLVSHGSSEVTVEALTTPQLQVSVAGSGNVRLNALRSDELGVAIAGSGDVAAAGKTAKLRVKISGSGDVDAAALPADEVVVSIAGSGEANVHADKSLMVAIAGSGSVNFAGDATMTSKIAGSGSVRKR